MSADPPLVGRIKLARFGRACAYAAGAVIVTVLVFTLLCPAQVPTFAAVRAAYVPSDAWLLDRHGAVIASRRIRYDVRRLTWVPLPDVSPALVTAIVEGEDRHFWRHHGVDWRSVGGAARDELIHHHRRGASTITMQLANLLRGHRAGSGWEEWLGKLQQVRVALSLERSWTKPEIPRGVSEPPRLQGGAAKDRRRGGAARWQDTLGAIGSGERRAGRIRCPILAPRCRG